MAKRDKLSPRIKRYMLTTVIGNGLEWYDFAIFGYFTPVFSKQFFPTESASLSLISTFTVFAVGFLARPLGGYFFGKIGDQQGRKVALLLSMLLMAVSTTCMGLLPTFSQVGILAPIFLTLLRVFQGISIGGEFTGSLSFLLEHAPREKRGFIMAWTYCGGFLGGALGAAVGTLITTVLSPEQMYAFGWRMPFILGFGIALIGYYLRKKLEETPLFLELIRSKSIERSPLKQALHSNLSEILLAMGLILPTAVWTYFLFVFIPTYLTQVKEWNFALSLFVNIMPNVILILLVPFAGYLSDLLGKKRVLLCGQAALLLLTPFALLIFSLGTFWLILMLQLLIAIPLSFSYGPMAVILVELFPTPIRSTSVAFSYNIATGIFGGMTPLVVSWLSSTEHTVVGPLSWFVASGVFGLLASIKFREIPKPMRVEV